MERIENYKRVQKRTAKKLFNNGVTIYLQSSKMIFNNIWQQPLFINKDTGENFDTICNSYSFYNCDNYRGRYIHFYVKK